MNKADKLKRKRLVNKVNQERITLRKGSKPSKGEQLVLDYCKR